MPRATVVAAVVTFLALSSTSGAAGPSDYERAAASVAARASGLGVWHWNLADNSIDWDERMHEIYATSEAERKGKQITTPGAPVCTPKTRRG